MRFGDYSARYNEFYYGSTDGEGTGELRFDLAFDWDEKGDYYQNEAPYLISWNVERGRDNFIKAKGDGFEPYDTGKGTFVLDNSSGRFDPYNQNSEIYGYIEPGKKMRFRIWDSEENQYDIFVGTIDDIINEPERQICTIKCVDPWGYLRKKYVKSAAYKNAEPKEIVEYILDYINYPWNVTASSDLSYYNLPYWVADDNKSAAALLWDLSMSIMRDFVIAPDGTARWGNYVTSYSSATSDNGFEMTSDVNEEDLKTNYIYITEDTVKKIIHFPNPWEEKFSVIRVDARSIFEASTDYSTIYQSEVLTFTAGETKTIWAKYSNKDTGKTGNFIGAVGVVSPVAGTDFIANSAADGSGSNTTSDFGILFTDYGTQAKIELFNYGTSTNYLTKLEIRGIPVLANNYSLYYPSASQENAFSISAPFMKQPPFTGSAFSVGVLNVEYIKAIFDQSQLQKITVQIENRPSLQFKDINQAEAIVYLRSFSNMAYFCRVGKVIHESGTTPQQVMTTFKLEPRSPCVDLGGI